MIKVTYYCDKCKTETDVHDIFELVPTSPDPKLDVPVEVVKLLGGRHLCRQCLSYIFRAKPVKMSERKTIINEDGIREVAPNEEHVETSVERDRRKTRYVSKKSYDAICQMYKDGKELEEISDALMIAVCEVSKVISTEGLGDERYKGKYIPSEWSAPIKEALPIVTKKGGGAA